MVFSDKLGTFNKNSLKLHLRDNVTPIFHKPRPLAMWVQVRGAFASFFFRAGKSPLPHTKQTPLNRAPGVNVWPVVPNFSRCEGKLILGIATIT